MALIKEPYGLVYNTNGSVCTTVRPDQIPFPGVNSFAVETATENLIQNPSFETKTGWYSFPNSYNIWTDEKSLFGSHCLKRSRLDTSDTSNDFAFQKIYNLQSGVAYTLSAYVNVTKYIQGLFQIYGQIIYTDSTAQSIPRISYNSITNGWVRKDVTFIPDPNKTIDFIYVFIHGMYSGGNFFGEAYVDGIQLEKKPFASSFVVGSRQTGGLVISVEDLMFDIANDDWVISYWKYPVATRDDTQNSYNECTLGQWTDNKTKGYITFGKNKNMNKYHLGVILNNATYIGNTSYNTFNPTDYFYHWHYEVLKKQGKVLSYYVDGVKQCELIIPADKEIQTPFDVGLSLGGATDSNIFYPHNALIAAPYYGYNSATWTDEYIREVYEAKIPFSVQSQLSIY